MASDSYTDEIWKDIPDWEGWYQASSLGRVRSVERRFSAPCRWGVRERCVRSKIVASHPARNGYLLIRLCRNGQHRRTSAHVVVCEAFHGARPSRQHQVAHGDGDRTNNRPENLRWATQRENDADKVAHGTDHIGRNNPNARLDEGAVREIRRLAHLSGTQLASRFGISSSHANNIKSGKVWGHIS